MSNLPSWISVEEKHPRHGDQCAVYKEYESNHLGRYFEVTEALYFSDVNKAVSEEDYRFNTRELEGVSSGFFIISDDGEGCFYADLIKDVKYWMPAYGLCDTTTSGQ